MTNGQSGKGDRYRPVDQNQWNKNWEKAFGKKTKKKPVTKTKKKKGNS